MTMKKKLIFFLLPLNFCIGGSAQTLVEGGNFKDRILPMHGSVTLETQKQKDPTAHIWGAQDVQNRYIDNGCEIDGMNLWGGNVYKEVNGKFYQFIAGWDGVKNAFNYWSRSHIYRVTSDNPYGPFTNPVDIGNGHNPEIYRTDDGTYVVYALINNSSCWRYTSKSINGPWTFEPMPYNLRDRKLLTGSNTTYSNWTFAKRQDGSMLCMCRGGGIWISRDGLQEYGQVKGVSCYSNGGGGTFEDPVIWRDEVQYHMIVNDWKARIAYYSRSADGFHWVHEDGTAYAPNVSVHPDGQQEKWYKYERPKVFQDQYGRAIQLNMAVIDTIKAEDKANDIHSSKNIAMPLNPGMRMAILNPEPISTSTEEIKVIIYKEEGFEPTSDIDIESLRFGSHSTVNKGGGAKVSTTSTDSEGNLILTFNGSNSGITSDEFAPKMIGKYVKDFVLPATPTAKPGGMCYGYAKLPYYNYKPAYLSPILPQIGEGSMLKSIHIDNYGLSLSRTATVKVTTEDGTALATGTANAISPYACEEVVLTALMPIPAGSEGLIVEISEDGKETEKHPLTLSAINALQATFKSLYDKTLQLYNNAKFVNGREKMLKAINDAKQSLNSFCSEELNKSTIALESAVSIFKSLNPNVANVSCHNYYIKAGNISSGNMYMYVADDGTLARKGFTDESCVFTLVIDGDKERTYLYNPASERFVIAKAGNGNSFWTTSTNDAYKLSEVKASGSLNNGYTIKGDPTSTSTFNYLNAYGGANHTELSSYTETDKNSQWLLIDYQSQRYTFNVENITTGLDDFLETINKTEANITNSISETTTNGSKRNLYRCYTPSGIKVSNQHIGLIIRDNKKYIKANKMQ